MKVGHFCCTSANTDFSVSVESEEATELIMKTKQIILNEIQVQSK